MSDTFTWQPGWPVLLADDDAIPVIRGWVDSECPGGFTVLLPLGASPLVVALLVAGEGEEDQESLLSLQTADEGLERSGDLIYRLRDDRVVVENLYDRDVAFHRLMGLLFDDWHVTVTSAEDLRSWLRKLAALPVEGLS